MKAYGREFLLDLHNCDPNTFTRESLRNFCIRLCELIDMERGPIYFWDEQGVPEDQKETEPHIVGTSVIQFIRTSSITIHSLHVLRRVYLNVFSCKDFDAEKVEECAVNWFQGDVVNFVDTSRL